MTKPPLTDQAIERLLRNLMPPGAQPVSIRVDGGPPRPALLYRTDVPFKPIFRELKGPNGETLRIETKCSDDGYALLTWELR